MDMEIKPELVFQDVVYNNFICGLCGPGIWAKTMWKETE